LNNQKKPLTKIKPQKLYSPRWGKEREIFCQKKIRKESPTPEIKIGFLMEILITKKK